MSTISKILAERAKAGVLHLPLLLRALSLVWKAAPRWTSSWIILLVMQGVLPAASVHLLRLLIDSLSAALGSTSTTSEWGKVTFYALLFAALILAVEILRSLTAYIRAAQGELVKDFISTLIHEKSGAVDLAQYDSSEYYDHLHRAQEDATYRPLAVLEQSGSLVQHTVTFLAMLAVLIPYSAWLPVLLVLSSLPALIAVVRFRAKQHQWRVANTEKERRSWYYDLLLTGRESALELRLFSLGDHFREHFKKLREQLRKGKLSLLLGKGKADCIVSVFVLLLMAATMLWMLWRASKGEFTLGELTLFYQAFRQGLMLSRNLLENVGELYANSLFLGDLFYFFDMQPGIVDGEKALAVPKQIKEGISFKGVAFSYPGTDHQTLSGFNLEINSGEFIALVGANGTGKSTVVKLLCRLYDPLSGSIELNGINLRDYSIDSIRNSCAVLCQEAVSYNDTVNQNIGLGDIAGQISKEQIIEAAKCSGAHDFVSSLPDKYETLLGRWFSGGADLSAGEWRRLALTRTLIRNAPIVILDEPASAMDPTSTAEWIKRFRDQSREKIVLIITHRYSIARHADRICLMDAGKVIESGTHKELLTQGGRYARGWAHQQNGEEL